MGSRSRFFGIRGGKKSRVARQGDRCRKGCQLGIERLEDRRVLASVSVTNNTDDVDGTWSSIAALIASQIGPGKNGISLREAIETANAAVGEDIITIDAALAGQSPIQLTKGELEVTDSLKINGLQLNGQPNVTIIPEAGFRAFHLTNGELELNYLRVTGAIGGDAAIESTWDTQNPPTELFITVSHCLIDNNTGTGVQSARDARIEHSAIKGNGAYGLVLGGGSVFDCTIEENGFAGILGEGFIAVEESTIQGNFGYGVFTNFGIGINKSSIHDNSLDGLYVSVNHAASVSISESKFTSNRKGVFITPTPHVGSISTTIEKTTVADNDEEGLCFYGFSGTVRDDHVIRDSTVARNYGGGVLVYAGGVAGIDVEFKNTTISKNETDGLGGGIETYGPGSTGGGVFLALTNATITENIARDLSGVSDLNGGGLWIGDYDEYAGGSPKSLETASQTIIVNSIISGNKDGDGVNAMPDNIAAPIVGVHPSYGVPPLLYENEFEEIEGSPVAEEMESRFNFIGTGVPAPGRLGITNGPQGNQIGFNNPQLTPLGNYGGITETHVPLPGSPVVDKGDPSTSVVGLHDVGPYDQRGNPFQRRVDGDPELGARIDIGAVEKQSSADFDENGIVDGTDFLIWQVGYGLGPGAIHAQGDANFDGKVDSADLSVWKSQYGTGMSAIPFADSNANGMVGGEDFIAWASNFGLTSGATLAEGDFDGDGDVDNFDFLAWQIGFSDEVGGWYLNGANAEFADLASGTILVSSLEDEDDGDYRLGRLSLREALDIAAQASGVTEIIFASGLAGTIELVLGALNVTSDVTINGSGADKLAIDADGASRVIVVNSGVDATISGLTITGGAVNGDGAGIYNSAGNLTLSDVVVAGNAATGTGLGGGLFSQGGTVTVVDSEFHGNTATRGGAIRTQYGAVLNISGSSLYANAASNIEGALSTHQTTAWIENSTFSGNSATHGGAIRTNSTGQMTIVNSTIVNNTATGYGGGIQIVGGTVTLHNTILANNTSSYGPTHDVHGTLDAASSYNIIGAGASGQSFTGSGNQLGTPTTPIDPLLAPLGNYGGKTKTHALKVGSPALDKASDNFALTSDQRGFAREYDLAGVSNGGDGYRDIGAYEAGEGTPLIVRSSGDRNDAVTLAATIESLRLREALALSAALAGGETITFDPSLYASGPAEITLTYDGPDGGILPDQLLLGGSDVSIQGPGADKLTVNGNGQTRLFSINAAAGTEMSMSNMTLTGGNAELGGAIAQSGGDMTLASVRIIGNSAVYVGGAIFSQNVERLRILSSEISDNVVGSEAGGGIFDVQYGVLATPGLEIINSTISNNTVLGSSGFGGGLYLARWNNASTVYTPIVNSTIAFNTAAFGGGIYTETSSVDPFVRMHNSIVTDNVDHLGGHSDIEGLDLAIGTYNLIGIGGSGGLLDNVNGNIVLSGVETSGLMALDYYGGTTRTHALMYNSAAVDAGDDAIDDYWGIELDQRGYDRTTDNIYGFGDGIDIGAFELAIDELYA